MPPTACKSSGLKTGDAAIKASSGKLWGFTVYCDGTNDTTCLLYDNASAASGTALAKFGVAGENNGGAVTFAKPVAFSNGCFLDITTTGGGVVVYYE